MHIKPIDFQLMIAEFISPLFVARARRAALSRREKEIEHIFLLKPEREHEGGAKHSD
jgi:hypothetical protein